MDILIERSTKLTLLIAALIYIILAATKQMPWAGGFFIGACWSVLNFLFTLNILKVALLKADKTKMWLMLLVKFPVLYLLGFIILISRAFPVYSLLLGAGLIFVVIGANKLFLRVS